MKNINLSADIARVAQRRAEDTPSVRKLVKCHNRMSCLAVSNEAKRGFGANRVKVQTHTPMHEIASPFKEALGRPLGTAVKIPKPSNPAFGPKGQSIATMMSCQSAIALETVGVNNRADRSASDLQCVCSER